DDVPRSKTVGGGGSIAYSATADRLYAYNNQSTEFGFRRITVDENGATQQDNTGGLICCFNTNIKYDAGRIYSTHGEVVDPEPASGPPRLIGTYSGIGFASDVAPDATIDRVYFISGNQLVIFRLDTFTLVASYNLPSGGNSLIRWGDNGLAYTNGTTVYLVRVTEDGTGPAGGGTLSPSLDPVSAPSALHSLRTEGGSGVSMASGDERSGWRSFLPPTPDTCAGVNNPCADPNGVGAAFSAAGAGVGTLGDMDSNDLALLTLNLMTQGPGIGSVGCSQQS